MKKEEQIQKCPRCHGRLIDRKRRFDLHPFKGCENYPVCRYTISSRRRYNRKTMDEVAPPVKGKDRHHINGMELDDRPENIYYCSHKEHMQINAEARRNYKEFGWSMEQTTRWWIKNKESKKKENEEEKEFLEKCDRKQKRKAEINRILRTRE